MSMMVLRLDLAAAKALVWLASFRRDGELTPEAHLYFYERYTALADFHMSKGHAEKGARFRERANQHRQQAGFPPDGPPYAAAMAMLRPRRWITTDAIGRMPAAGGDSDNAA